MSESRDEIDRLADAPLHCFATYAASISYELATAIEERARCGLVRCYGTMDFGGLSMSTLDDGREARIRTVGKPFADNDLWEALFYKSAVELPEAVGEPLAEVVSHAVRYRLVHDRSHNTAESSLLSSCG